MVMTMVGQVCPCSPQRSNFSTAPGGFHIRAWIPEGHFDPMSSSPGRTRGPVERAAHAGGEEFWPSEHHTLEHSVPEEMHLMGGIHAGESNEEM